MTAFLSFFSPAPVFTIISVGVAAVVGFSVGVALKSGHIAKHKKRVLHLEDEMLANHSRILKLEKMVSDLKKEKANLLIDKKSSDNTNLTAE